MKKEQIVKLVEKVNKSKKRIEKNLYPLEYVDDGWRIILPSNLDQYTYCRAGRKLLENAIYDYDFYGDYYWIAYSQRPDNITTPAIRFLDFGK